MWNCSCVNSLCKSSHNDFLRKVLKGHYNAWQGVIQWCCVLWQYHGCGRKMWQKVRSQSQVTNTSYCQLATTVSAPALSALLIFAASIPLICFPLLLAPLQHQFHLYYLRCLISNDKQVGPCHLVLCNIITDNDHITKLWNDYTRLTFYHIPNVSMWTQRVIVLKL